MIKLIRVTKNQTSFTETHEEGEESTHKVELTDNMKTGPEDDTTVTESG